MKLFGSDTNSGMIWKEFQSCNPNESGQSELIPSIRINSNDSEKFDSIRIDRIDRIHSDCTFGLIHINSD